MKKSITVFALVVLMLSLVLSQTALTQTVIFSDDFESGTANAAWGNYYKGEDSVKAKPMAQAPKVLATGGNFVGWLQDLDGSYTGSAVAVTGALTLKDYSIEADVYCYVNPSPSGYTGLVVYADSSKKDFYKMRADFDASNRINFSGLKSDPATFLPLFSKDFKGADNAGLFPTTDGWHKMKIEVRSTSATVTTIWCYFDGTLLKNSPITDTLSARVTSGGFGLYAFQQSAAGIPGYFDNIVVKTLPTTLVQENSNSTPSDFHLSQNYPNPFNPETKISYRLSTGGFTSLTVYDQLGRTIRTLVSQYQASGEHAVVWDGKDNAGKIVSSGVYFYSLKTGAIIESKKMVLLK